jgi:hypothetical protein
MTFPTIALQEYETEILLWITLQAILVYDCAGADLRATKGIAPFVGLHLFLLKLFAG